MKSSQELAIEKTSGPCLILAGAGTGKTWTIVHKIAYLIEKKVCKSDEILCLTFSNEATNNLRRKVIEEVKATDVTIRTFHGFCADILKERGHMLRMDPGFEILEPDDAVVWFYKYLDISPYNSDLYAKSIQTAKDLGISMAQIAEHTEKLKQKLGNIKDLDAHSDELDFELKTLHLKPVEDREAKKAVSGRKKEINEWLSNYYEYTKFRAFVEAWKGYDRLKQEKNVLDFADLNYLANQLFDRFGATETAKKYKYVLVDEFQDTNKLQFELIEHLAKDHKNITVVGDINQSIYGFRGAYKEGFDHFREAFGIKEDDIFRLDKSRRSPNTVLRAAHTLIQNNYEKPEECFLIENYQGREGNKVEVITLKNSSEEARKVAELVEGELDKGTPMHEVCVLCRTHRQAREIRQALDAKNINYLTAGRTDLMSKPEVKMVISYLSILNNLANRTGTGEQAWWGLFHYQNALSPEDSVLIGRFLKKNREDQLAIDEAVLHSLEKIGLSSAGKVIIKRIHGRLEELMKSSAKPLPELVLDIYELSGLSRAFTHTRTIRNVEALMNLKQFYEIAEKYEERHEKSLASFIDYIEILDRLGVDIDASKIEDKNAVRLMTIHAVKGLEFHTVIVTNMAEKRFPIERTYKEPLVPKELNPDIRRHLSKLGELSDEEKEDAIKDYEKQSFLFEERRLCYVAWTRAKERLVLTYAKSYNAEPDSAEPSLFLREVEFEKNSDMKVEVDEEEKCTIFAPCSKFEQFKSLLKKQLVDALDSDDFPALLSRLVAYHAVREGKIGDYAKTNWKAVVDEKELKKHLTMVHEKCSCLKFDPKAFTFSPTALLEYDDCPKRYELSKIFQMPERGAFGWSAASTGSFVHEVLEVGVKENFKTKEEFLKLAEEMALTPEWQGADLKEVNGLISVFWERHKGRYNEKTKVEMELPVEIGGFRFYGLADRVDFLNDKDVSLIDYKTDRQAIAPRKRAWQLGFYAIALKKLYGLNAKYMTLEMLRLEKPYEAEVDADGNVMSGRSRGFNINEVEKELVECAKKIVADYEGEFKITEDDSKCMWCGFKFYCPKWEEK